MDNKPARTRDSNVRHVLRAASLAALPASLLTLLPISTYFTLGLYGYGIFFLVPLVTGILGALVLGERSLAQPGLAGQTSMLSVAFVGLAMLVVAWEGLCCLLMAVPIALPLTWIGSRIGVWFLERTPRDSGSLRVTLIVGLPVLAAVAPIPVGPHVREVTTVRIIAAPPEQIWPLIQNLPDIPPPKSPIFLFGMAYPLETRTVGEDRECVLTTGTMSERVVRSEPPRWLQFEVLSTPPAMREVNPFGEVRARHLHEGFRSRWGEFRLDALPDGRTRVTARSQYELRYEPIAYWSLWSDAVVLNVHAQVLDAIAKRAEGERRSRR